MSLLSARRTEPVSGPPGFNPETDVPWLSLNYAEGSDFKAQGYANTDPVTTWPDEIAGENPAIESTTPPEYRSSVTALNNKPAVYFDGINDRLQCATLATAPTYPLSIVLVIDPTTVTGTRHILDGVGATNRNLVSAGADNSKWTLYAGAVTAAGTPTIGSHLLVAVFDGSTAQEKLYVDGTQVILGTGGSEKLTGAADRGFWLGIGQGGVLGGYEGHVAFRGFWEGGDITTDETAWPDFTTWVTDHYGITIT